VNSVAPVTVRRVSLNTLPIDQQRGWHAMWCVIATEFMLFVCMFGSYYYLGANRNWKNTETPPHLAYAFILLAILGLSSVVLGWGERQVKIGAFGAARAALWITVGMGLVFVVLQCFEYIDHWKTLAPYSDSYGSIFYAITTLHAVHVIAGLLMLSYVGVLPRYGKTRGTPHRVYSTVALYWHFVDFVWVLVVALLYVAPNLQGGSHGH
jgi:cytochrome c oxidase subunit III